MLSNAQPTGTVISMRGRKSERGEEEGEGGWGGGGEDERLVG